MDKHSFKEWAIALETSLDKKLTKWVKGAQIENGEAIHFGWQFEQTHMLLDIFWEDGKETVQFAYISPRRIQRDTWHGFTKFTIDLIMDRVGNLAQNTMHPYKDYRGQSTGN